MARFFLLVAAILTLATVRLAIMKPIRLLLTGLCLSFLSLASAQAGSEHVTADGRRIPMPDIASLECLEMMALLEQIDASGYRGNGPFPLRAADRPLYDYERALAARHYADCAVGPTKGVGSAAAFRRAFGTEE